MGARDLAAEVEADNAQRELEALRELRAAVLAAAAMMHRGALAHSTPDDKGRIGVMFDEAGYGPIVVVTPIVINELAALARKAAR